MAKNIGICFTQISNFFIDEKMKVLSGSATRIFLVVARKTTGWHKETDSVCYKQLQALTGMAKTSIASAIKELESHDLIQVDRAYKQVNKYTLKFDEELSSSISGVQKLDTQKKENTKEKEHKGVPPYSLGFLEVVKVWRTFLQDKNLADDGDKKIKPYEHDPEKPTKTLDDANRLYLEIINGLFVKEHPAVRDMLHALGITKSEYSRKITQEEIIQTIEHCLLQYCVEYWPESASDKKKILPKSLAAMLLNVRNTACPSVFMKLFYRPPTPLARSEALPVHLQPAAAHMVRALNESGIYSHDLTASETNAVKKAVKEIADLREGYIERVGSIYKLDKRGNYLDFVH